MSVYHAFARPTRRRKAASYASERMARGLSGVGWHPMKGDPQDVDGAKRVGSALLRDCIYVLGLPHPPMAPGDGCTERQYQVWRTKWVNWANGRARELRFLNSDRSLMWCEIMGMDRDRLVDLLRDKGVIYDHREMVPEEARPLKAWTGRKREPKEKAS